MLALSQPSCGQTLCVAAFLHELSFERRDLMIEEEVRLVNQAKDSIGNDFRPRVLKPTSVEFPVDYRIRPIRRISPILVPSHRAHCPGFWILFAPLTMAPLPQVIFKIEKKLVQAGPGDVDQPKLGLARDG